MPFSIEIPRVEMDAPAQGPIVADRRLYLTDDRLTVVEAGDEKAAWLFCVAGHSIPGSEVTRLALVVDDGRVVQRRATTSDTVKQRMPGEDKMRGPGENKGQKK